MVVYKVVVREAACGVYQVVDLGVHPLKVVSVIAFRTWHSRTNPLLLSLLWLRRCCCKQSKIAHADECVLWRIRKHRFAGLW